MKIDYNYFNFFFLKNDIDINFYYNYCSSNFIYWTLTLDNITSNRKLRRCKTGRTKNPG